MRDRLEILLSAVAESGDRDAVSAGPPMASAALFERLLPYFDQPRHDRVWLALATLKAQFPVGDEVVQTTRSIRLDGAGTVLRALARSPIRGRRSVGFAVRPVSVVTDTTVVDVHHTARTGLATGIQRVARQTLNRWDRRELIMLTGWDSMFGGLRTLSASERENALHGTNPHARHSGSGEMTIPWRSTYILPELALEPERVARIAALAEFSGNATYAVGFDCVPLTTAETTGIGMGGAFAKNLAALARFDKIATISRAAEQEYTGWRAMLSGAGLKGPEIREVFLATDAQDVGSAGLRAAREALVTDGLPLLLCVGSHEPRKNHVAVLNACELLWREGREFCLAFVGGNAWGGNAFSSLLKQLKDRGRPVRAISAISDDLLWGGYRIADATVFPSLNEGFGLPVAESLAVGTPVVTSGFGSMREIAAHGGAVLVDPRDDVDLARGIESAIFESAVRARLLGEAASRALKSWDDYAAELWEFFHAA